MSTADHSIVPDARPDVFAGARMFALICYECDDDGGHADDCPGRVALGIDDGKGSATTMVENGGSRPTFTHHDDAERAEAFYGLNWPVQLVWATGTTSWTADPL